MSNYNQGAPQQGAPYQQPNSPYPPQGGYQQGYAPPQGPPPGQYGQAPPQMNQGWNQPPPQQGFAAPQGPPPGWNQPPPQQQGWNQPPPQQGYAAPQGPPPSWNQQPPQQQQGWNQAPPQQQGWNQPPPQQGHSPYPQQQGFAPPGGAPPGQSAAPSTAPPSGAALGPSKGYNPNAQPYKPVADIQKDAKQLREAMKGMGTNESLLIQVLSEIGPQDAKAVRDEYKRQHSRDLIKDIHGETSGYFRDGLEGVARGPLDQDCHIVYEAIKGAGTKESALDEVLLGRSNADMNAIKQRYRELYKRPLETDVKGDLSMKTEQLFDMVMSARRNEESVPVNTQQVDTDVQALYFATEGKAGADQVTVCQILSSRSNNQIRAIATAYQQKYHHSLEGVMKKEFSGHMQHALMFMVQAGADPAKNDADRLEDSMRGAGTKDTALVRTVLAVHWDLNRLTQCKGAYKHFHKQELSHRIQGETSGDYEKLMVACINPRKRKD